MSQNYNVYVSANHFSIPKDNKYPSTMARFNIRVKVMTTYVSDVTVNSSKRFDSWESFNRATSVTRELKDPCTEKLFTLSSCRSLTWDAVSRVISDMNIPFSLERIQWKGNPGEDWIPLMNQNDIITRILHIASGYKTSTDSAAADSKNLNLHISFKKETILPQPEFNALVKERRLQEIAQKIQETISYINQQQISLDSYFWESMIGDALRELGPNFDRSMIVHALRESAAQAAGCKPTPAIKSSIDALEEVVVDNQDPTESCAICMEKMEIGSVATRMPCSHTFHKCCIVMWLGISNVCPLCRLKLPTV